MKILVTGANGFLGRNICEHFAKRHDIVAPSHAELDLRDEESARKFMDKSSADVIIHCASVGGGRESFGSKNVIGDNLRMFTNLARNSESVERMIYFGSGAEYGKHRDLKKAKEGQIGEIVPKDDYGFCKYACNQIARGSDNIINLRLFGIFGKHENYETRFVSNAILKGMLGMPIKIVQNVVFDYLYVKDLMRITDKFLKITHGHRDYNVTPDRSIDLISIAKIVNRILDRKDKPKVMNPGMNFEYTGDNGRLKEEIGAFEFLDYEDSINDLYRYYEKNLDSIDKEKVIADRYVGSCKTKK